MRLHHRNPDILTTLFCSSSERPIELLCGLIAAFVITLRLGPIILLSLGSIEEDKSFSDSSINCRSAHPMNRPHQRKGSVSNAHVGRAFERLAHRHLASMGIETTLGFVLPIGIRSPHKDHEFDLGASSPAIVVECKSHRWTEGDKVPSAKMAVWNEAMYYFSLVPNSYKRILFVLHDRRRSSNESLVEYYLRTYGHLIPMGVEIWEYDEENRTLSQHLTSACDENSPTSS